MINWAGDVATLVLAERCVLGNMLALAEWSGIRPKEFFLDKHQQLAEVIEEVLTESAAPEGAILVQAGRRLAEHGVLESMGGWPWLQELIEEAVNWNFSPDWRELVRRGATERLKRTMGVQLAEDPNSMDVAQFQDVLQRLEEAEASDQGQDAGVLWEEEQHVKLTEGVIDTGLVVLDQKLRGISRGNLLVIGARTSHGKTALATTLARRWAERGWLVEYVTLEETGGEIGARWLSQLTGVRLYTLQAPIDDIELRIQIQEAQATLAALPLTVVPLTALGEDRVVGVVRASQADIVVVDHLQQIVGTEVREPRHLQIARVLVRLQQAARAQRKLLVVTAQLNRGAEMRETGPELADLKDSGAIEEKASKALILDWPARRDATAHPSRFVVKVDKNRGGPTGMVDLFWDAATGRFASHAFPTGPSNP
jgi:replicative DNA helicase